ncbi:alpha/beta hydrolase family protein [Mariniflexile gromovii]|uniref:Acetylxylan esterase n=1 Tax=Mariniflexile gromovii TaxID=362523 RepID=A0ABS4BXJ4_9FLAO|nr:alpha/beta fold hydrolase [Mariniflexile gromovii]MBP0905302.1 acetylxylan esterase [Mariniflexile gromovii]
MLTQQHIVINGKHTKPIVMDVTYPENKTNLPIIIFCHGYKGFKDWGAWNLMAKQFAEAAYCFIKFNFSHNGGTVEQPIDFPDLEAFGNNNYTKELDDLESVIDWVFNNDDIKAITDPNNLSLIGHSRGGGITLIKAEEDNRIKSVVSLASVSDYARRMDALCDLEAWKQNGVTYILNGRTHQQMPHYYQFYEDFIANEERLTIKRAVLNLKIPHLIIRGNDDTSVLIDEAKNLHQWNPNSELIIIDGANHVFGASHPWEKEVLPEHLSDVVKKCIYFLKTK